MEETKTKTKEEIELENARLWREHYIKGLRELALLFEQNPLVPVPSYALYITVSDCTKEQLVASTHIGKKVEKDYTDTSFAIRTRLGEHKRASLYSENSFYDDFTVRLSWMAEREQVCEKVVLGTKIIPEEYIPGYLREAREEEIVEWKCSPLLAPDLEDEES